MKKKILFFTGNRSEYYLIFPVLIKFLNDKRFNSTLLKAHNLNYKNEVIDKVLEEKVIKKYTFNYFLSNKSIYSNLVTFVNIINKSKTFFKKIKPDIIFLYGDRFETYALANASFQLNIPIAHIEGGDITNSGLNDDSVRHAITKLSHLHFPSNEKSKNKIIKLGEEKWRIKNIGFTGNYYKNYKASKKEIENRFLFNKKIILFTLHPEKTSDQNQQKNIKKCMDALQHFSDRKYTVIITGPNDENGNKIILKQILKYYKRNKPNMIYVENLGSYYYLGIMSLNKLKNYKIICVGNSSSIIKETPIYKCPAINVGRRQKGRLQANNVINCDFNTQNIIKSIFKAFSLTFEKKLKNINNPYHSRNYETNILNFIYKINLKSNKFSIKKEIY